MGAPPSKPTNPPGGERSARRVMGTSSTRRPAAQPAPADRAQSASAKPDKPQAAPGTPSASPPASAAGAGTPAPTTPSNSEHGAAYLAKRTELVLREIDALPTLPSVATKLLQLGINEDVDVKEIVRVIETDPTLTAKLLSMCKKAAVRTRVPITTVEMAVVMLGLEAVRALVLSVEIFEWTTRLTRPEDDSHATGKGMHSTRPGGTGGVTPLPGGKPPTISAASVDPGLKFSRVGFWQHSIAVACAADLITREYPHLEFRPEEAFVCGLIHDLGKLALDWVLPKAYTRVVELAAHHQADIAEFETAVVGLDHARAGAHLAERWGLPELVRDAIAGHHNPGGEGFERPGDRAAGVVAIADALCRRLSMGWSGNYRPALCDEKVFAALGIDQAKIEEIAPRLYDLATARCRELGLGEEPSQQLLLESILRANARLGKLNQQLAEANRTIEEAQNQLAEARTLARLGQMTAGAAHEMNNPLAVISGRAQALLSRVRDDRDRQTAQAILDASQRLSDLIVRLHRIASPPQPAMEAVDLGALVTEVIARGRARHAARAEAAGLASVVIPVKLQCAEGLGTAWLDRELIADALVEVLANAMEAKPRTGVEIRLRTDAQDRLCLEIADDGMGMSENALAHAMDPFFSDKPAGRQSGLGLALADRLVRLHAGEILMTSRVGKGTAVTLRFASWRSERSSGAVRAA